jgi:tRNA threonylcarbamoyl adenosine modification protein (Sua5/YciO/YrdC/YwlC family)
MAQYFSINAENPQARLITQTVAILEKGGIVAIPTDSSYAIACLVGQRDAQESIRHIRQVDDSHHFTLMCRNLSELSTYAKVGNSQFRLLKANTPGPYTFILEASRELPKRLQHPKRSTIGLRVPNHSVVQAVLEVLDAPLLSMTLQLPEDDIPMSIAWEIRERLEHQIDAVIESDIVQMGFTTVVDLTAENPQLIRQGVGDIANLGLEV